MSIGLLMLLGDKLKGLFDQKIEPKVAVTTPLVAHPTGDYNFHGRLKTVPLPVTTTEHLTKQISSVWQPANSAIQVAGANGATQILASTFTNYVQELLNTGKVTQEQANLLFRLANDGHSLANAQSSFEKALQAGETTVVFEGKSYQTKELGSIMGFTKDTTASENWTLNPKIASPVLRPFAETYQAVQQDAVFQNSDVKQTVTVFSLQIGALADALSWSADETRYSNLRGRSNPYENYLSNLQEHFTSNMSNSDLFLAGQLSPSAQTVVRTNAESICVSGTGSNINNVCQ